MNLDDLDYFDRLDTRHMLDHIDGLPSQLRSAWEAGLDLPLPAWEAVRQVVIAGMGGSAIGGELLRTYLLPGCRVPVYVQRDYGLPAWAFGQDTLLILSSHSGNTEEVLSAFEAGLARDCRMLSVTTGGQLAKMSAEAEVPTWRFQHHGQPRAAVGFSFGLLLAAFNRLGLVEDPSEELYGAVQAMLDQQTSLQASMPAARNPAKRLAGQMVGRWVSVIGSGILEPVARRWKGQINELSKSWAQFEALPEADHNTLAGVLNPEELLGKTFVLFLHSPIEHPRLQLRHELTRKAMMLEGLNTDFLNSHGTTPLANLWTCLHFGDYCAYYLAMAYGVDPTPVPAIEAFKKELEAQGKTIKHRTQS